MFQRWNLILREAKCHEIVDPAKKTKHRPRTTSASPWSPNSTDVVRAVTRNLTAGKRKNTAAFNMEINSSTSQVKFSKKKKSEA